MMRTSDRRKAAAWSVFLALLAGLAARSSAEDQALLMAAQLRDAGECDAAITELKRFLFFNPGHPETWRVQSKMAACYQALGQWDKAVAWYSVSSAEAPDEPSRAEAELDAAATEMAAGSYSAAEFRLLSLRSFMAARTLAGRDALYLGLVYVLSDRPEEADRELRGYIALLPVARQAAIGEILAKSRQAQRRSPGTARLLSTLLPGLGQVYAGNLPDGVHSLFVTSASAALVVAALLIKDYAEAALAFTYLFQRYYAEGRSNAEQQAASHNAEINRSIAVELLAATAD